MSISDLLVPNNFNIYANTITPAHPGNDWQAGADVAATNVTSLHVGANSNVAAVGEATALGHLTVATAVGGTALGYAAEVSGTGTNGTAIGQSSSVKEVFGIAVGQSATVPVGIGQATCVGYGAIAQANNDVCLGQDAGTVTASSTDGQLRLGTMKAAVATTATVSHSIPIIWNGVQYWLHAALAPA